MVSVFAVQVLYLMNRLGMPEGHGLALPRPGSPEDARLGVPDLFTRLSVVITCK